jgi:5,5'-dehydrodivanillate O-demethylase
MDDTHTLNVAWFIDRVAPGKELPASERIFHWNAPIKNPETGRWLTSHELNRKFVIWLNQGNILDRTQEHLSQSDKGLVMMRNKAFSQIDLVADGGEPKATLRDPEANRRLVLPMTGQKVRATTEDLAVSAPNEPVPDGDFPYLAGQPPAAAEAYRKVIATWSDAAAS